MTTAELLAGLEHLDPQPVGATHLDDYGSKGRERLRERGPYRGMTVRDQHPPAIEIDRSV